MRKLLLLLTVFLALAALVYFYEIQGEVKREETRQREESLLRISQEEVTALEISPSQKESIAFNKEEGRWMIERPIRSIADMGTVGSLLRDLGSATRDRILLDAGSEIEKYGLDLPRFRLLIEAGQERKSLLIGSEDFTGTSMYVQLEGDADVFLTSRNLFTAVDKELFQWRDKKVLAFERPQVQAIELQNSEATIRLERRDDQWFMEAPLRERADQSKVTGLLSTIEFGEVQEFVDDHPKQLELYGLMPATATLRIQLSDPLGWKTLEVGREDGENSWARNSDWPFAFTVQPELPDRLNQGVWDFRDKSVVDVDQTEITRVLFRRGEEEIVIRYRDYTWTVEKPDSHKDQVAQAYQFWYPITDIAFQSIYDDQSGGSRLSEPDVRLVVTFKDGVERIFDFVQAGDRFLAGKVKSGRQGTISEVDFEKLLFEIEDILDP